MSLAGERNRYQTGYYRIGLPLALPEALIPGFYLLCYRTHQEYKHTYTPAVPPYLYHPTMTQELGMWDLCVCAAVAGTENEWSIIE